MGRKKIISTVLIFLTPPHIQNNAEPFNIHKANGQFLGAGTNKNTGVDALRRMITAVFTYKNPHLTRFNSIQSSCHTNGLIKVLGN